MHFLARIRQKPRHVRSRIALGAAFGITAVIAVVWSTTLPARFADLSGVIDEEGEEQTGAVQDGFNSFFESIDDAPFLPPPEEVAQPQVEPESPGAAEPSVTGSLSGLEDWDTTPRTEGDSSEPETDAEASEPRVILIGTTPKTAE